MKSRKTNMAAWVRDEDYIIHQLSTNPKDIYAANEQYRDIPFGFWDMKLRSYAKPTISVRFGNINRLLPDKIRKEMIVNRLKQGYRLYVNGEGCLSTSRDKLLKQLIKDGKIERHTTALTWSNVKRTYYTWIE